MVKDYTSKTYQVNENVSVVVHHPILTKDEERRTQKNIERAMAELCLSGEKEHCGE